MFRRPSSELGATPGRSGGPRPRRTTVIECSLEEFQARYGSDERYAAHLVRRLSRTEVGEDSECWVVVYGSIEPHAAIFSGESRRLRQKRFRTRRAAEVWAARLLGIAPDRWRSPGPDESVVH
jgi:hypothetical protein